MNYHIRSLPAVLALLSSTLFATSPAFAMPIGDGGGGAAAVTVASISKSAPGLVLPGRVLDPGEAVYSKNGIYYLTMQGDGNLVFYRKGKKGAVPLFASKTNGHPGATASMQSDGNLVVYYRKRPLWASRTSGHEGAFADVQSDGNLVIYDGKKALWASRSGGLLGQAPPRRAPAPASGGSIQDIITRAFAPLGHSYVTWALCIAYHESTDNPNICHDNDPRQACGLFQFEPGTWAGTPYARDSRLDPVANSEAAAWLVKRSGASPWQTADLCPAP